MKEKWLKDLEVSLSSQVNNIINEPHKIDCIYRGKTLSVSLTNLINNKKYLISAIRGTRNIEGHAYIDLFYVMPHFQGKGLGSIILDYYSRIQKLEGEDMIQLKPVPVLPEHYNPWECIRLYAWLGKAKNRMISRPQLIRFYRKAGFEALYPGDIGSEMCRLLTA